MIKQYTYKEITMEKILSPTEEKNDIANVVSQIISEVRQKGDKALGEYSQRFDGAALDKMEVTLEEIQSAYDECDRGFISILEEAAEHIRGYHQNQKRSDMVYTPREGVILGQKITPLERVGLYVPGGTANYPSTVLMNAIPAKIAGVKEVIMVSPAKGGKMNADVLVAAKIAGIDRIYKVGGAQAIAALAYGTETIPRVDKIVGPGNAFVAEAKKQVFGKVSIDMIAGPSEILVIADGKSDASIVAADMLSQAEHDVMARAILITDSKELAHEVSNSLEQQIPFLPRKDIARKSIDDNGKIILTENIHQAIKLSNEIAPEHLELCIDNPFDYLADIRHAGSIFLGRYAPEALGDYFAGTNHTLPTAGSARFASPLSVDDFIKKSSFTYYTKDALAKEADKINIFAQREGLFAHGKSATIRIEKERKE
ncbi:histidinol dehydrogenase [Anaerotignum sp.]|uniref:histidinol dehydrogenase n=1 Tax=Anaerotignum sp. TaxID=2039241 RepID=UPI00332972E3